MRILIVGGGPAGLTFAASLLQHGIEPVVVEKAPANRAEGYAVGLHVNGWNVAERLGLLPGFKARAVPLAKAQYCDPAGRPLFSYDYRSLASVSDGKMLAIMRDAVQDVLLDAIRNKVEIRYGTTIEALADDGEAVAVTFADGSSETFDIVVGADGWRSRIRELHFGPHDAYIRPLGYRAAAWRMPLDQPMASSFIGMMDVNLQGGLYAVGDGTAATLFCWRDPGTERVPPVERSAMLQARFGNWAAPVGASVNQAIDWQRGFFDTIAQVDMPAWSKGRVVLLGDSAWCLTFLSGQGTSTAMAGAYILAGELAARPHADAFASYESRLREAVTKMQAASRRIGGHYVPQSRTGLRMQAFILPLILKSPLRKVFARGMAPKELVLD